MIEILDRIAKQKVEKSFDFLHSINNTGFEKAFRDIIDEDFILWVYSMTKHDHLFRLGILLTVNVFIFKCVSSMTTLSEIWSIVHLRMGICR